MEIGFSSLLVLSFLLFVQQINAIDVHIVDGIEKNVPPLKFHCASGDDDLGMHTPKFKGSDFKFSFKRNIFLETLFFCYFWWGSKNIAFEVYRDSGACGHEGGIKTGVCYWLIKEDGFYFAIQNNPPPSALVRKYGW